MPRFRSAVVVLAAVSLGGPPARAAENDAVPLGHDDPCHTLERAGYPCSVSPCARPGRTDHYCGYHVGGGCPFHGGPPGPLQGTWGWDYCCGPCLCHHVVLGWCRGCRPKVGSGAYKTDGPHVPNVFGVKLPHHEGGHGCEAACGKH